MTDEERARLAREALREITADATVGELVGQSDEGEGVTTLSFATTEYSLTNIARAFGIPASEIAGGRLPIGRKIGLARIDGAYVRGVLQNGTTAWINVWGCSQDVSNVAMALNGQGAPPALPIALKPASGLHLLQVA